MKNYIIRVIAGICVLMFMLINYACDDIFADVWSEPVKFYNTYGNSAVFKPTSKSDGEIYFCSAGNISTSGTKYRTIGYKLSVKKYQWKCNSDSLLSNAWKVYETKISEKVKWKGISYVFNFFECNEKEIEYADSQCP